MEAPERIYFQIETECGGEDRFIADFSDATRCVDRIKKSDVEYVRRDVAVKLRDAALHGHHTGWIHKEQIVLLAETAWLAEEETVDAKS